MPSCMDEDIEVRVGIAEIKTGRCPARLITLGLGSCVGVSLWDRQSKWGGMAHVMLPDSSQFTTVHTPGKFADLAIPLLLEEMRRLGLQKESLVAKLAGGAHMFTFADRNLTTLNIGERNVMMVKKILQSLGIKVLAEEIGGSWGRTMILDTKSGEVFIRTIGQSLKTI